jgi:hypothetical protein
MGKDAPCVGPEALNPIIPFMCEFEKSQLGLQRLFAESGQASEGAATTHPRVLSIKNKLKIGRSGTLPLKYTD